MTQKTLLIPPFTAETARKKVQAAEDGWNTRDPEIVALAYSEDTVWRNRDEFLTGRDAIKAFLYRKWRKELHYKLMKGTLGVHRQPNICPFRVRMATFENRAVVPHPWQRALGVQRRRLDAAP